jgi:hypothetical protein
VLAAAVAGPAHMNPRRCVTRIIGKAGELGKRWKAWNEKERSESR